MVCHSFWSVVLFLLKVFVAACAVLLAATIAGCIWIARLFGRFLVWLIPPLGRPL